MKKSTDKIRPDYTVESYALRMISEGKPFNIDLKRRSLTVDGIPLVTDGAAAIAMDRDKKPLAEILEHIEDLYARYKRSIPSKKDTDHPSRYFQALREEDLTNEDMMYGERRNTARFKLEYYVLREIVKGNLRWDSSVFGGKAWFWQSQKDRSLVLLKEWMS